MVKQDCKNCWVCRKNKKGWKHIEIIKFLRDVKKNGGTYFGLKEGNYNL